MEPLEADAHHPARGFFDAAYVEVECCADSEHEGGVELGEIFGHEALLFWRAEADPDDVGFFLRDVGEKRGLLGFVERAKGRAVGAEDAHAGEAALHFIAQRVGDSGRSAVEIVRVFSILRGGHDAEHEVGAIDAADPLAELSAALPDERHSVAGVEECFVEDLAKGGVSLCFMHAVDSGDADVAFSPLRAGFERGGGGDVEIHGAHGDTEDVEFLNLHAARCFL